MVIWITRLEQRGHAGFPPKKWTPQRKGEPKVLNVGLTPFLQGGDLGAEPQNIVKSAVHYGSPSWTPKTSDQSPNLLRSCAVGYHSIPVPSKSPSLDQMGIFNSRAKASKSTSSGSLFPIFLRAIASEP